MYQGMREDHVITIQLLVNEIIDRGYSIAVYDEEDCVLETTKDIDRVLDAVGDTGLTTIEVRAPEFGEEHGMNRRQQHIGTFTISHEASLDPGELIIDYSWNAEEYGDYALEAMAQIEGVVLANSPI